MLGAERADMTEVINGLQQAGLAGCILTRYEIQATAGIEFNLLQISELPDRKA